MKKAVAAIGSAMVLLAMAAPPALAEEDDTHIVLYKEGGDSTCWDKDFGSEIPNPTNDDVIYVCFDYPGPL